MCLQGIDVSEFNQQSATVPVGGMMPSNAFLIDWSRELLVSSCATRVLRTVLREIRVIRSNAQYFQSSRSQVLPSDSLAVDSLLRMAGAPCQMLSCWHPGAPTARADRDSLLRVRRHTRCSNGWNRSTLPSKATIPFQLMFCGELSLRFFEPAGGICGNRSPGLARLRLSRSECGLRRPPSAPSP
jgi:hypothetical protein